MTDTIKETSEATLLDRNINSDFRNIVDMYKTIEKAVQAYCDDNRYDLDTLINRNDEIAIYMKMWLEYIKSCKDRLLKFKGYKMTPITKEDAKDGFIETPVILINLKGYEDKPLIIFTTLGVYETAEKYMVEFPRVPGYALEIEFGVNEDTIAWAVGPWK